MKIFDRYAEFYDLAYQDKDYEAESKFVDGLIRQYTPNARSILDLGCGTGRHTVKFAEMGYAAVGMDLSTPMIRIARERQNELAGEVANRLRFVQGDIRSTRLQHEYDAVVSLFHVLSYQTTDNDVKMALETITHHLSPQGICLFDFWYGPAILTSPPSLRLKRFKNNSINVVRVSEPTLHPNENIVDVDYVFFVWDRGGKAEEFHECHLMRYFFIPELRKFINAAGLDILACGEWLTPNPPSLRSWSVYAVAKRAK
jgi:SAM-dependent methyltransferase